VSHAVRRRRPRILRAIRRSHRAIRMVLAAVVVLGALGAVAAAPAPPDAATVEALKNGITHAPEDVSIKQALVALPVAGLLGAALAFRPQRRGTPSRQPAVIQTQIILALVGALVMLVVGASLARAFGIVGAASLVRYRAKVDDPKDAGIMLSCLGIGLASGVGIYWVATFSTLFILCVVWILESLEPKTRKDFMLKIGAKDSPEMRTAVEEVLKQNKVPYELRAFTPDDLTYAVKLPLAKKTDAITHALMGLGGNEPLAVEWSDKKSKDKA
jgi:uncharacterized membrane protein YhiD involved in acid resistance